MNLKFFKSGLLLLFVLLAGHMTVYAQGRTVTGLVMDDHSKPMGGVSIVVKGTTTGTTSGADGAYSVAVPSANAILVFSHVGFGNEEIKVGDQTTVNAYLTAKSNTIDEVVVVGYGSIKRANLLGSVASVRATDIEDLPVANLSAALINRVPGVSISQTAGKPGASVNLTIRHASTLTALATVDPLYVIDGIIYDGTTNSGSNGKTAFDNLDASEIESISFLKDAEASIYGARAANGVVLVTTKRGKPGKPRISYTGSFGISHAAKMPQMLSGYDQAVLLNNKYRYNHYGADTATLIYTPEELEYLKTHNYNWVDDLWSNSYLQRHTINVSGGSDKLTYFAGANYYNETGNLSDLYAKRFGLRFGATANITKGLTADISISTDQGIQNRPTPKSIPVTDQNDQLNGTMSALLLTPQWTPLYINGNPILPAGQYSAGWNPAAFLQTGSYSKSNNQGVNLNSSINYQIPGVKGLTARVQYGLNKRFETGKEYYAPYTVNNYITEGTHGKGSIKNANVVYTDTLSPTAPTVFINDGNLLALSSSSSSNYQLDESISYARKFGKHDLSVMVLAEQAEGHDESFKTSATTQVIPGVDQLYGFSVDPKNWTQNSSQAEAGRLSYLGRLNYAFNDRYLLEGILRADASPNFPSDRRWGYFPSVAVGWKISEENFFKHSIKFIDELKIRFNVGLVGNDNVAKFLYLERYTTTNGYLFGTTQTSGLGNTVTPNSQITWGKALFKNLGIDGSILNRKVNFTVEAYHKLNYDELMKPTAFLPTTVGQDVTYQNYAKFKTYGIEAMINYNGSIGKDFRYNIGVNFDTWDNLVIQQYYSASDTGYKYPIGRRTDDGIEGYKSTGIVRTKEEADAWNAAHPNWTVFGSKLQAGGLNFEDINGDGIIDGSDQTRIAKRSNNPYGFGFNLGASWKGFKWSTNIALSFGGSVVYDKTATAGPTETANSLSFWTNSWTPDNPDAKYPLVGSAGASVQSSFWVVKNTVMRVNNMTLSYTLPATIASKWGIPSLRLYVVGTNLWDIINTRKYKYSGANVAVDYPILRAYTFGASINL